MRRTLYKLIQCMLLLLLAMWTMIAHAWAMGMERNKVLSYHLRWVKVLQTKLWALPLGTYSFITSTWPVLEGLAHYVNPSFDNK